MRRTSRRGGAKGAPAYVLDAYAVLCYLQDEAGADEVGRLGPARKSLSGCRKKLQHGSARAGVNFRHLKFLLHTGQSDDQTTRLP